MKQLALVLVSITVLQVAMIIPAQARPNLQLTVTNTNAKTTLVISVAGSTGNRTLNEGPLDPGKTKTYQVPVPDTADIDVLASLRSGTIVDDEKHSIQKGDNSLSVSVDVVQATVLPDDAANSLITAISDMHYTGLPASDRAVAINLYLGAVVFYDAGNAADPVLDAIPPSLVGTTVKPDDVTNGQLTYESSVEYTTGINSDLKVTVPAIVAFGFGHSQNTLYQVHYLLSSAGHMSAKTAQLRRLLRPLMPFLKTIGILCAPQMVL